MSLLFVTVICDLYKDRDFSSYPITKTWSESWLDVNFRLKNLKILIDSEINMIIFAEKDIIPDTWEIPSSVKIIWFDLRSLETYVNLMQLHPTLPNSINSAKDRLSYFALMNSKLDFIQKAKMLFPQHETYCWIDCGIFKFIKDVPTAYARLMSFNDITLSTAFLAPVGMLPTQSKEQPPIVDYVYWRFLGSIFFIKNEGVDHFKLLCDKILQDVLNLGKITWEVNVWAILESTSPQLFETYHADHNDSIFDISTRRITNVA
jgi:hypothetical protein